MSLLELKKGQYEVVVTAGKHQTLGLTVSDIATVDAVDTATASSKLCLTAIDDDSLAKKRCAALRINDAILEINGVDVRRMSYDDARDVLVTAARPIKFVMEASRRSREEDDAADSAPRRASTATVKLLDEKGTTAGSVPVWASLLMLATVVGTAWITVAVALKRDPTCAQSADRGTTKLPSNCAPPYLKVMTPLFFVLMAVELILLRLIKYSSVAATYRLADAWSSISAGLAQQLFDKAILKPLLIEELLYFWIQDTAVTPAMKSWVFGLDSWLGWCLAFIAVDCAYYWLHRWAHEYRFLWAGHSVHHSGEHYNLSTALRQSWQQSTFGWVVYMPLALFAPFSFYIGVRQLNLIYQFWVHTCVVRRLGVLEYVLMTPSHHRVHHDRRVHKNFGGTYHHRVLSLSLSLVSLSRSLLFALVRSRSRSAEAHPHSMPPPRASPGMFIIWDRMFGTFTDENDYKLGRGVTVGDAIDSGLLGADLLLEEPCLFGARKKIGSWTDSSVQLREWFRCCTEVRSIACTRRRLEVAGATTKFEPLPLTTMGGLCRIVKKLWRGPGYSTTLAPRAPVGNVQSHRLRSHSAFDGEGDGDGSPRQQLACASKAHVYIAAHFTYAIAVTTLLLEVAPNVIGRPRWNLAAFSVVATLITHGLLLDGRELPSTFLFAVTTGFTAAMLRIYVF